MVEDPTVENQTSKQYEYNSIHRRIGEEDVHSLLVDFSRCRVIDVVLVEMLVALTHRIRDKDGNAVGVGLSNQLAEIVGRLMALQPQGKRAMWANFPTRESAFAAWPW